MLLSKFKAPTTDYKLESVHMFKISVGIFWIYKYLSQYITGDWCENVKTCTGTEKREV